MKQNITQNTKHKTKKDSNQYVNSKLVQIIEYLELYLKYTFKNKSYIEQALTHKSFCIAENKNKIHNERFEFLGDAVLGLIIAEYLMVYSPSDSEGALSKKRASLVNQNTLSEKAQKMNLQHFIILGPGEKEQESHLKPRILASAYEALLGVFYLDAGLERVKKFIISDFDRDIEIIKPDLEYEKDFKTRLQEIVQKLKLGIPVYKLENSTGPSHKPEFEVSVSISDSKTELVRVRAIGSSKKMAEQLAAEKLIKELNSIKKTEK